MAEMQLYADSREGAVIPFLRAHVHEQMLVVKQMTRGDYAIASHGEVAAIFERKTHKDYADSIRDGRTANKAKMLELRGEGGGVHVYYIIEGPHQPSPDTEYGRIKWSTIESSIMHLMTEYGIMIIKTRDTYETARHLGLLLHSYSVRPPRQVVAGEGADLAGLYEQNINAPVPGRSATVSLLFEHQKATKTQLVIALWTALPGFGMAIATKLAAVPVLEVITAHHDAMLRQTHRDVLVKLREPAWNSEQQAFLRGIGGIGPKSEYAARSHATCLKTLWVERQKIPAKLRLALEAVMI